MTLWDLFFIVFIVISKAKKDDSINPLGVAYQGGTEQADSFLNVMSWIALAVFIIFLYVRLLTY